MFDRKHGPAAWLLPLALLLPSEGQSAGRSHSYVNVTPSLDVASFGQTLAVAPDDSLVLVGRSFRRWNTWEGTLMFVDPVGAPVSGHALGPAVFNTEARCWGAAAGADGTLLAACYEHFEGRDASVATYLLRHRAGEAERVYRVVGVDTEFHLEVLEEGYHLTTGSTGVVSDDEGGIAKAWTVRPDDDDLHGTQAHWLGDDLLIAGDGNFGTTGWIARFGPDGEARWALRWDGPGVWGLVVHDDESSTALVPTGRVIRLTPTGEVAWTRLFDRSEISYIPRVLKRPAGGVLLVAKHRPTRSPWLAALDADGNVEWERIYPGPTELGLVTQVTDDGEIHAITMRDDSTELGRQVLNADGSLGGCLESLVIATRSRFDSLDTAPLEVHVEDGTDFQLTVEPVSPFDPFEFERADSCFGRVSPAIPSQRLAPVGRRPSWP